MTARIRWATGVAAVGCLMTWTPSAAEPARREDLGRRVKLRIVVDKVMQPTAKWVTEEWMVKASADAGFNVFSPRAGYDRLDEVRQVAAWCKKYGIYHMPWMRGTLAAPMDATAAGKRVVWANGVEQPLWSVNSDEFWAWTTKYIVAYAEIAAENPHLMGVFLDYENYAKGKQGNLYSLSYDDGILHDFAAARGVTLPSLAPADRKKWLTDQGLHAAFAAFQVDHWRRRCRTLRQAVDEHNPTFQFCIYPAPGTPFMVQATYPEWATKAAPLILADASTYSRPARFLPQAESLRGNREKLLKRMEIAKNAGIPFMYAGGIDPVVIGADPEFSGKNAVAISEVTDGYWIFYEGPKYDKDHPAYWKWFTWANTHIAAGNFRAQHEPRETPEDWTLDFFKGSADRPRLAPPAGSGKAVEFPIVRLRGDNIVLVATRAGEPVSIALKEQPVAHYTSALTWQVRDPTLMKAAAGTIAHGKSGVIEFVPKADGLHLVAASAGSCAYSIVRSSAPLALYAGGGLKLIYGAKRLYFHVPGKIKTFTVTARGWGAETVRVNVLDPTGKQVSTGQTTRKETQVVVKVAVGAHAGKTWSLEVARADAGVLEDVRIWLGKRLPPALSLCPEHVFTITKAQSH